MGVGRAIAGAGGVDDLAQDIAFIGERIAPPEHDIGQFFELEHPEGQVDAVGVDGHRAVREGGGVFIVRIEDEDAQPRPCRDAFPQQQRHRAGFADAGGAENGEVPRQHVADADGRGDGVVLRENWLEAYRFLTPQAAQRLNEIARDEDPFSLLGTTARSAIITSIVQRSDETWQVSWIEATHGANGGARATYTGLFTIRFERPRNADALTRNPLGLFITEFSFSPEAPPMRGAQP